MVCVTLRAGLNGKFCVLERLIARGSSARKRAEVSSIAKKLSQNDRFFLTLNFIKSIPSLAASFMLQHRCLIDRENRQMATKKAAKKAAKKTAKKK
jgi:ribonuclease HII